jgi:Tfp pilus assembly protein PilV
MRELRSRVKTPAAGMTMVEVMMAVLILFVVFWGTIAFVTSGRVRAVHSGQCRTAVQLASERLEIARGQGYAGVQAGAGTVDLDGSNYTWTVSVANAIADPYDANSAYRTVEVTVDWPTSLGETVTLRSAIAP